MTAIAKAVVLIANIVLLVIRAPHGIRSLRVPVAKSRMRMLDLPLVAVGKAAFSLPFVWVASSLFAFADYPLHPVALITGTPCLAWGLWLFHRSHVDLGTNWSQTLEVRENHSLVTEGVYRRVRHPMYLSLLVFTAGQALVLPNYVAGPCPGVAMVLLLALRVSREERMMVEEFGEEYEVYRKKSKRLIPGVW